MKKILFIIGIFIFSNYTMANNEAELKQVLKDFKSSIAEKDKEKFLDLFVDSSVSWIGVNSASMLDDLKRKASVAMANGERVRRPIKNIKSSPEKFIINLIDNVKKPKEEFKNVKIQSDGEVANIFFEYIFFENNEKLNWGHENWSLVKSEQGWKINSVIFSISRS